MEIGLEQGMPTYSGGLGILAADTIQSAADLRVPLVAVTLLHRKGYFHQTIDASGWQREEPVNWAVDDFLEEIPGRASVTLEGETVHLRAWKYDVRGIGGSCVPVLFLDSDLPENSEWHRTLTNHLYGGDDRYRICQEALLGIGGVRMLRALGHHDIRYFHLNEGHAGLLALELLDEWMDERGKSSLDQDAIEAVRKKCVFTTHTPVPAGHDQFPIDLVQGILGNHDILSMKEVCCCDNLLNMTLLSLNLSHYVNGVAKKHGEVSRDMLAPHSVDSITNGVHAATWTSQPFQRYFDEYIPGWREDNFSLRYALGIPKAKIWDAHQEAKRELLRFVNREANAGMDKDVFTLGFARRATKYKRGALLFQDLERLKRISANAGPLQVIFAGKAHPRDESGKEIIRTVIEAAEVLGKDVRVAFLPNYDRDLGKLVTAGVDVWLNTPEPPMEASGTSGMKAALNGVPSLSVLDGWWIEGHIEGVTGWSIGPRPEDTEDTRNRRSDIEDLYHKLETIVVPMFYKNRNRFLNIMCHSIALNGSFFNTQRMMLQYVTRAYFL
jgi:starch phosphorylase